MSCPVSDRTFPPLAHRVASDRGRRAVDKTWKSPTRLARSPHTKPGATCPLDLGTKTAFHSPREFAVWLGLTPKTESSGEKRRLSHITKRGDTYLRTLLIQGANAALRWTAKRQDKFSRWANDLLKRRGRPIAIVAVAHKMARIAWTLLQRQTPFQAQAI